MVAILFRCLLLRPQPNISEKVDVFGAEQVLKVIFDLLHGLVVWGDASSDEAEGMGVSVDEVDVAAFDVFLQVLGHVKASGASSHDGEAEGLVGPDQILALYRFHELRVVIG